MAWLGWFTLRRRHVHALSSMALPIFSMLVTVRSSPTTWNASPFLAVNFDQFDQSSSSNGSSMVTTG